VSDSITLTLRSPVERIVEAECLVPNALASLGARDIAHLPLWEGPNQMRVGDLFDVRGERSAVLRITGDLSLLDAVGAGMTDGELTVDGHVGRYVATRMTGGVVRIQGNAGYGAGLEMGGGVLDIQGNAGDRVGAARLGASKGMTGGEIIVRRAAGDEVGARMRRGTIVCGQAGARAAQAMIAGNLIVLDALGEDPGPDNKRGSIVVLGGVRVPDGYRYACTYRPPHVALTLASLRARHALPVTDAQIAGHYRRYSGDLAELGKGEILEWRADA